jgi:MYXO-CTERM domain-containing protein
MKLSVIAPIVSLVLLAASNAAVTINIRNFSSATVGVPIVSSTGTPVDQGGAFASAGIFGAGVNFTTMTATQVLGLFTSLDATPVALNANFDGLFSGADLPNLAYPGAFAGQNAFILVGNNSTLANSTLIAVYNTATLFPTPDGVGNAAATLSATTPSSWVYGIQRTVTTQPSLTNAAFTTGIEMTSVPEPTAALLGVLGVFGLVRRRR